MDALSMSTTHSCTASFPKTSSPTRLSVGRVKFKICIEARQISSFCTHDRPGRVCSQPLTQSQLGYLKSRGNVVRCERRFDSGSPLSSKDPEIVALDSSEKQGLDAPLSQPTLGAAKSRPVSTENGGFGGNFGGDSNGSFGGGGGRGGGGGGDDGENKENDDGDNEFGPVLCAEEVFREAKARGAVLPADMVEAAKAFGMRKLILSRYLDLQASGWPLGIMIRGCAFLRNRMLADPAFLFKVLTEITIDSCCATFAEVQKRGKEFWNEFELFLADLLVGIVVDIALVGMLAPFVRFGQPSAVAGMKGKLHSAIAALPSSVFEAAMPGRKFSVSQRVGVYFYKGVQYCAVGFVCGIIGQGIANSIMVLKRKLNKSNEAEVPVPPLVKSAALWGVFLAVSSNTRYQIVNGLERVVESSPFAKRVPPIALAFTVGVRFANNIYGGMQFVDWARLTGVQ